MKPLQVQYLPYYQHRVFPSEKIESTWNPKWVLASIATSGTLAVIQARQSEIAVQPKGAYYAYSGASLLLVVNER
jgi:hypothetical protein